MKTILEEAEISLINNHDIMQISSPSWLFKQPVVIFNLTKLTKKNIHSLIYQEKVNIQENYPNYSNINTYSSKDINRTGCGAVFNKEISKKCLPKEASIFTTHTQHCLNQHLKKIHHPF